MFGSIFDGRTSRRIHELEKSRRAVSECAIKEVPDEIKVPFDTGLIRTNDTFVIRLIGTATIWNYGNRGNHMVNSNLFAGGMRLAIANMTIDEIRANPQQVHANMLKYSNSKAIGYDMVVIDVKIDNLHNCMYVN